MSVDAWWAVSHGIAGLLTVSAAGLWLWKWRSVGRHFFFLFFFSLSVAYLDIFPVLALHEYAGTVLVALGIGPPAEIVRGYVIVQLLCLIFFQLPLVAGYFHTRPRDVSIRLVTNRRTAPVLATAAILFSSLFLWVLRSEGLLMSRVTLDLTPVLVGMSPVKFLVYRLFQESAVFLTGVLFFLARLGDGRSRVIAWTAWTATAGAYAVWAGFNSRWSLLLLLVCTLGFWLASRPSWQLSARVIGRMAGVALLSAYLAMVVVNFRRMGFEGRWSLQYFVPQGAGAFGDEQSYMRLNGIDLMARLLPRLEIEGPAWGAAWASAAWYVRRFTDPEGFDEFRLSRNVTAKSYLMERYLGWNLPDYFSCTLTDLFGNFHVLGLLAGTVFFVAAFRFAVPRITSPTKGAALVLGLFVIVHVIVFDQEALALLFAWTKKLPVLLAVLALRPFRVEPGAAGGK